MQHDLSAARCVPCEGGMERLSDALVRDYLSTVPAWTLSADAARISRSVRLQNFAAALALLQRIGAVAEQEGHHPDLHLVRYRHVSIELWTHAVHGLTTSDFVLAAKLDRLLDDPTHPPTHTQPSGG